MRVFALLACLAGCRAEGGSGGGSSETGAEASTSTTSGTTMVVTTGPSTSASEPDLPNYDIPMTPDVPPDMGCKGIDFLFAIDNSGSMFAHQNSLLLSFPGFIEAIQSSLLSVSSYHVGVVTSDEYLDNEFGCRELGDLVTETDMEVCGPFEEGHRFATEADDLDAVFPCIAGVGTGGDFLERPVSASIAALDPQRLGPDGCNEDFLRDDAILVLVIVTDDPPYDPDVDDAHPSTDTSMWYEQLLAAKGGDPNAVVVIGFIPWDDVTCVVLQEESPNLIGFVDAFGEQGIKGSICETDYSPVFGSTVETIQFACDNYIPQG